MQINEKELADFLVDSGLAGKSDIAEAKKEASERKIKLVDALIGRGVIAEDDVRRVEAYVLGIPYVSLVGKKIEPEVLSMIPEPVARNNNIIAFKKNEKDIEVAMINTDDLAIIESIKKKTGLKVLPRLTDNESIKDALSQYQKSLKEEFGDIISKEASSLSVINDNSKDVSEGELKKMAEDLPVVRVVDTLLRHAILQDASDIHIEPMESSLVVRYRVDGILHDAMTLPKDAAASIAARIKVLSRLKLDEKRLPQDGRFKIDNEGEKVSFRVSIMPTFFGEKVVMRLLREGGGGFTLESLGFHGDTLERIHVATRQKTGIILVTGPTGSGKTTTLYTILDILNTPDVNISTIEDPIEYQMPRVNQTQVKPDIGFTFSNGLRSLMRQDPDIIMVGEIRDAETAALAINAALTGHLVLSTLHTNSAAGAIPRLIEMGAERFLLASTLRVVVGQRLVRMLCAKKDGYQLKQAEVDKVAKKEHFDAALKTLREEKIVAPKSTITDLTFYHPAKSKECEDGYKGRRGIHEVLAMSPAIREAMLMDDMTSEKIEELAQKEGMLNMLEDGLYKAARGDTSIEEVLRVVSE